MSPVTLPDILQPSQVFAVQVDWGQLEWSLNTIKPLGVLLAYDNETVDGQTLGATFYAQVNRCDVWPLPWCQPVISE